MTGRIVIDLDLPPDQMAQLRRTGFVVHKRGSSLRLEVGGGLIAQNKATVRFEDAPVTECSKESPDVRPKGQDPDKPGSQG